MTTLQEVAVYLHMGVAPAVTVFALLYLFRVKWWRTLLGKALATHATGMMLLVDVTLVNKLLDRDTTDIVRVVVYSVIFVGSWLLLIAYVRERVRATRKRRRDPLAEPVPPADL